MGYTDLIGRGLTPSISRVDGTNLNKTTNNIINTFENVLQSQRNIEKHPLDIAIEQAKIQSNELALAKDQAMFDEWIANANNRARANELALKNSEINNTLNQKGLDDYDNILRLIMSKENLSNQGGISPSAQNAMSATGYKQNQEVKQSNQQVNANPYLENTYKMFVNGNKNNGTSEGAKEFDRVMNRVDALPNFGTSKYYDRKREIFTNSDFSQKMFAEKELKPFIAQLSETFNNDEEKRAIMYGGDNKYILTVLANELHNMNNMDGKVSKAAKAILSGVVDNYRDFLKKGYGEIFNNNDEESAKALFMQINETKKLLSKYRKTLGAFKDSYIPLNTTKDGVTNLAVFNLPTEFYDELYSKLGIQASINEIAPTSQDVVNLEIKNRHKLNKPSKDEMINLDSLYYNLF